MGDEKKDSPSYQFIKEDIVHKKGKKIRRICGVLLLALICGALFGITARGVYIFSARWFPEETKASETVEPPVGADPKVDVRIDSTDVAEEEPEDGQGSALPGSSASQDTEPAGTQTGEEQSGTAAGETPASEPQSGEAGTEEPSKESGETTTPEDPREQDPPKPEPEPVYIENRVAADASDLKSIYTDLRKLADEVNLSIVTVNRVIRGVDWFENPYETVDEESGLILALNGTDAYILTGYDQIREAHLIRIVFPQDFSVNGEMIRYDEELNLAIIRTDLSGIPEELLAEITPVRLGSSSSLTSGEPVLALGRPAGSMYSMLVGMTTSVTDMIPVTDGEIRLLKTDMIASGEVDGFLVSTTGRILGIMNQSFSGDSRILAVIGITELRDRLERMLNDTEIAELGLSIATLSDSVAENIGVPGGVFVTTSPVGSTGYAAGIRESDVLLSWNDSELLSVRDYVRQITQAQSGDTVHFTIYRYERSQGSTIELDVTIGGR